MDDHQIVVEATFGATAGAARAATRARDADKGMLEITRASTSAYGPTAIDRVSVRNALSDALETAWTKPE